MRSETPLNMLKVGGFKDKNEEKQIHLKLRILNCPMSEDVCEIEIHDVQ